MAGGQSSIAAGAQVPAQLRHAHLVGIGGAGMSGIARLVLDRGGRVAGSDAKDSRSVLALRALGARIAVGHAAENLDLLDQQPSSVVVSTAISEQNPELLEARRRGIPVLRRAEALAELMREARAVCVAGTHGKTSTTSMLTVALQRCGMDPSFAIGGDLNESGSNAHHGAGEVFVAEADESDGSFLSFEPDIAVVTNLEPDHLDHHGDEDAYRAVFHEFVDRIRDGGTLICCGTDPGAAALARHADQRGLRVLRYGFVDQSEPTADSTPQAGLRDYRPVGSGGEVVVELDDGTRHTLRVASPGAHMALNATAALLAGREVGADLDHLMAGISGFSGVRRRFEFKGRSQGVRVYDDYAHHPTEVAAQLAAARPVLAHGAAQGVSGGRPEPRLVVAFQPHLYSRTEQFAGEFGAALAAADDVVVLDVFGARETPKTGVSGRLIADAVPLPPGRVRFVPSLADAIDVLGGMVRSGDLVITMGAGDITSVGPELLALLDAGEADR